ncbi:DUF3606 domain-containing protein [Sphingobium sp. 10 DY56-G10]|uniref:DUF3606 domain-containing protein n=2 Tax=Alphaproteobacteria TaxID=28211 RepID=A0ABS8H5P5_9SPHN|nr:DUF3606 domain-containing protein [Sphingomonas sp. SKA58]EAT09407.1 hypothetical protein SKA58_03805 [Sphingomonas sp. SKA58]MCC4233495.1 DUF3606 domain-containing protein [Sphingobium soli]
MTTGESRRTPQDLTYVSLEREEDRLYWTNRFNVSGDELTEAVETVGNDVDAVAAYLNVGR